MPEFDAVAPLYDATRRPPSDAELDAVVGALGAARRVLEAGVGTGRYSVPLSGRGLGMTGIDLSPEMLRRAHAKGLDRLLLGDLHRLPFRDRSFDAALIVHVLQLIPDPFDALAELTRVVRDRVVAVFPIRPPGSEPGREGFRARYRELAAERGIVLPARTRFWANGARLLAEVPPTTVAALEIALSPDPDRERAWRDLRAFGGLTSVPEPVHQEIVAQIRRERGSEAPPEFGRVRRLQIAAWSADRRPELLAHRGAAPAAT